jgi:acyl-CoA synthetase (AMP-forming)/AMP-acid ligase II
VASDATSGAHRHRRALGYQWWRGVLPAGAGVTAEELDKHAKAHPMLADYKRPRRYRFVDELPRTATGKKMHYVGCRARA